MPCPGPMPVSRVWRIWLALMLFTIDTSLITLLIPIYKSRLGFGDTVVTLFLVCYMAALVGLTAALTLLTAAAAAAST